MSTADPIWSYSVGTDEHKVTALELATRKHMVYLRWRPRGRRNWKWESTGVMLRDATGGRLIGRARKEAEKKAVDAAEAKFAKLKAGLGEPASQAATTPLTLSETWAVVTDPDTGKYPSDSPHRREVRRELENAVRLLGADTRWNSLTMEDLTKLWRRRIRELRAQSTPEQQIDGLRGAEVTVQRVSAIAEWLRSRGKISPTACVVGRHWRRDLHEDWKKIVGTLRDYAPRRPRNTLDEMLRLIQVAERVDPRFDLLISVGAELRLGQVRRTMRSDLDLEAQTLRVQGAGRKRGTVVEFTPGQAAAVDRALSGYLRHLEAAYRADEIPDYRLFPGGQLPGLRFWRSAHQQTPRNARGRIVAPATVEEVAAMGTPAATLERHLEAGPIATSAIREWWRTAEVLAGVPRVKGRATYGPRRAAVDRAKELASQGVAASSSVALQNVGGWSDSQVPDTIYAEQETVYERRAGRALRMLIRGEQEAGAAPESDPATPKTRTEDEEQPAPRRRDVDKQQARADESTRAGGNL